MGGLVSVKKAVCGSKKMGTHSWVNPCTEFAVVVAALLLGGELFA